MLSQHYYVQVKKLAIETVKKRKGNVQNELDVQGEYLLQFGKYRGQSFRWMLENAPSYIGWFVDNIRNEKVTKSPISQNKAVLKKYVESFQEYECVWEKVFLPGRIGFVCLKTCCTYEQQWQP